MTEQYKSNRSDGQNNPEQEIHGPAGAEVKPWTRTLGSVKRTISNVTEKGTAAVTHGVDKAEGIVNGAVPPVLLYETTKTAGQQNGDLQRLLADPLPYIVVGGAAVLLGSMGYIGLETMRSQNRFMDLVKELKILPTDITGSDVVPLTQLSKDDVYKQLAAEKLDLTDVSAAEARYAVTYAAKVIYDNELRRDTEYKEKGRHDPDDVAFVLGETAAKASAANALVGKQEASGIPLFSRFRRPELTPERRTELLRGAAYR